MSTKWEDWDESFLDIEDYQVERAATNAALTAIRRARQFGTSYVIEENGRTKCVPAEDTGPYEKALLENVDRINRKIAELQAQNPSVLALNETPEKPRQ
jgi:DNA-directed RNA polymerase specialized sigma24 family protein